ncbi:MAG: carbamoyltransferase family protein [Agriterribacter sp.]
MYTLGINAAFHDCAACLFSNGELIAAAEEERFTQVKHGKRPVPFTAYQLPYHAIHYCLEAANITLGQVDRVAYSFDPDIPLKESMNGDATHIQLSDLSYYGSWDTLFNIYIKSAPRFLTDGYPFHLQERFGDALPDQLRWHFVPHHISHAASAFYPSPFEEAAIMVLDGRGEHVSTSYYKGEGKKMTPLGQVMIPHSLGLFYENVTRYLGFLHSSDEYKVMALASYGEPVYYNFFDDAIRVADGNYTIDMPDLAAVFGPARKRDEPFTMFHFNLAQSLQKVLEHKVLELATWLHSQTGSPNLCLAGGIALNCVLNSVLRDHSPFQQVWVQPVAGDAGTALGAAMWIDQVDAPGNRLPEKMSHVFWGPEFSDEQIEAVLTDAKISYKKMDNIAEETAALLAEGKIIGWFQGRMEFGPRSLGSRSILASPTEPGMQAKLNRLKEREDFRPVAPVVLEEDADDWFECNAPTPFMLFVNNVRAEVKHKIPAVTHVDGTARVQTVNASQHPLYYNLIHAFKHLTGVPVLVNTSFNIKGKPIVCTPQDALACFYTSSFDVLVMNSFLLEKKAEQNAEPIYSAQLAASVSI